MSPIPWQMKFLLAGPFSIAEAHAIVGGHFCTSPWGVIEMAGSPTNLHLIHHLSKIDSHGSSTNSWLDAAEFPTWYYSTTHCADFVHLLFVYFFLLVCWSCLFPFNCTTFMVLASSVPCVLLKRCLFPCYLCNGDFVICFVQSSCPLPTCFAQRFCCFLQIC